MGIKDKRFARSFLIIICLTAYVVFYAFFAFINFRKSFALSRILKTKSSLLKKYETDMPFVPSKDLVDRLLQDKKAIEEVYKEFSSIFLVKTNIQQVDTDPLKFKEELFQTQRKIREDASAVGVILPSSLGFSKFENEIPKSNQVPLLKNQLSIVDDLIRLVMDSGIKTLNSIEILESTLKSVENKSPLTIEGELPKTQRKKSKDNEIKPVAALNKLENICSLTPIKLEITSSTKNLIRFMYKLRASKFIYLVKNLKLDPAESKSDEGGNLVKAVLELDTASFF